MRHNFATSLPLLALIFIILPVTALAQRNTITGFVFGADGRGVEKARVELLDDMYSSRNRVQTDTTGRFVFNNVGTGLYQIKVVVPGSDYREQTQDVNLTSGRMETVQLDFRLKLRKEAERAQPAVAVFAQEVPEAAKRLFEAAAVEFGKGAGGTAAGIEQLQGSLKVFPTYFAALERLGVEFIRQSRYEEAIKTFTTAVAVNPRSFNCWYGLAFADYALERSEDAIKAGDQALAQEKNAPEVYFVLGMSQRRLKQYDKSEKAFLKAKELDKGKTPDIHWNLALLYAHNLQQYGKAADELELFLKYDPTSTEAANIKKLIASFRAKQAGGK
jgi:tetratricopeptide (TPR) repeat protein